MDLDIGSVINQLIPLIDYYVSFFSKLLNNLAIVLGVDLDVDLGLGDNTVENVQ